MDLGDSLKRAWEKFAAHKCPIALLLIIILMLFIVSPLTVGAPDQGSQSPPDSHFDMNRVADDRIELAHVEGDPVQTSNLTVAVELNGSDTWLKGSNHSEFRTAVYETNLDGVLKPGERIELQNISPKVERVRLIWKAEPLEPGLILIRGNMEIEAEASPTT